MFPMRLKIGPARNNEWRCCFCLHVRTATILLGAWHLVLHVVALVVLALLMRNHHMLIQRDDVSLDMDNILPTPLSKIKKDDEGPYYLPQDGRAIYPSDMDMSALMTVCTLAITLLLVYGSYKGKATHLLPFFCLQLFDFAITTLTATGFFFYLRSGHQFINDHWKHMPFRNELLHLNPQQLSLLVLVVFLLSLFWKGYCITIVWRCYKFLTLRQTAMRSTVHYILPGEGSERVPEPDYSTLLPDYEAACASAMKQAPPPSYQAAMENQPPTYPEATTNEHVVNLTPVHEEHPYRIRLVIAQEASTNQENTTVDIPVTAESNQPEHNGAESHAVVMNSPTTSQSDVINSPKEEAVAENISSPKAKLDEEMPSTSQTKQENN